VSGQSLQFDLLLPQGANSELGKSDPATSWQIIGDTARQAEELGYRGVWAFDRLDPLPRRGTAPVFDGWTTLTAIATMTERLRLGLVTSPAPHRDVLQIAKRAATLDVISGGRVTLALDTRYRAGGVTSSAGPLADLGPGAVETAEALRRLWAGGATSYPGRYVSLDKAFSHPVPAQPSLPLLSLGEVETDGHGPVFDGVIRRDDPDALLSGSAGDGSVRPTVFLDCRLFDDELERDRWLSSPHVIIFWSDHPDAYMRRNLVGTPERVVEQLQRYVDAGVSDFGVYFRDYPSSDSVRRFMTEVVPALSRPAADLAPIG
jgi:alkanesulfonate monooxygenase SsuD/methylene tetrahydromethanopterin reductase-like flavin-dependent oxidoreductase (luciferase family)